MNLNDYSVGKVWGLLIAHNFKQRWCFCIWI